MNSITVSASETLKAIAVVSGYAAASAVGSAAYTHSLQRQLRPTFSPTPGTFTTVPTVTITRFDHRRDDLLHHRRKHADVSGQRHHTQYTAPFALSNVSGTQTVNAIAIAAVT